MYKSSGFKFSQDSVCQIIVEVASFLIEYSQNRRGGFLDQCKNSV